MHKSVDNLPDASSSRSARSKTTPSPGVHYRDHITESHRRLQVSVVGHRLGRLLADISASAEKIFLDHGRRGPDRLRVRVHQPRDRLPGVEVRDR